jgi:hypothetical protein
LGCGLARQQRQHLQDYEEQEQLLESKPIEQQ